VATPAPVSWGAVSGVATRDAPVPVQERLRRDLVAEEEARRRAEREVEELERRLRDMGEM
jgi:hypothetical protein